MYNRLSIKSGGTSLRDSDAYEASRDRIVDAWRDLPDKENALLVWTVSGTGKQKSSGSGISAKNTDLLEALFYRDYERVGAQDAQEIISEIYTRERTLLDRLNLSYSLIRDRIEDIVRIDAEEGFSDRKYGQLVGLAERMKGPVAAADLRNHGIPAVYLDYHAFGMETQGFRNAVPTARSSEYMKECLLEHTGKVVVVGGFIGYEKNIKLPSTLARGGSDYTATRLGKEIEAAEIRIFSDEVVKTANPDIVPHARHIPSLSYRETKQFASVGASIIQPLAVRPAEEANIPIYVYNTFDSGASPTIIDGNHIQSTEIVKAVGMQKGYRILNILGFDDNTPGQIEAVSSVVSKHGLSMRGFPDSGDSVAMAFRPKDGASFEHCIKQIKEELSGKGFRADLIRNPAARLVLIGQGIDGKPEIPERLYRLFRKKGVQHIMGTQPYGQIMISTYIPEQDAESILQDVHKEFIEKDL